jgi:hypothetical protein
MDWRIYLESLSEIWVLACWYAELTMGWRIFLKSLYKDQKSNQSDDKQRNERTHPRWQRDRVYEEGQAHTKKKPNQQKEQEFPLLKWIPLAAHNHYFLESARDEHTATEPQRAGIFTSLARAPGIIEHTRNNQHCIP